MQSGVASAWTAAVTRLGGSAAAAGRAARDLERRYREPHRHYHTLTHVQQVLRDVAWLTAQANLPADERAIAELAACAHDVVYAADPGSDERASAQWARAHLTGCGVARVPVDRVARIVLATIAHVVEPDDAAGSVMLDADLAILAAEPAVYAGYLAGVRAEYRAVPDAQWRAGRAAVLDGLLARPRLYLTEPARGRWEAPARANVAAELETLTC